MASKVFISWGGDLSKKLAQEINNWLPSVLQFVTPYFTPEDIEKGARWESNIAEELSSSNVGIICLTKDNIDRPWILFEAGALSKNFGKSNVCTILFDVDSTSITGPLTCFQATKFEKADFKKLLQTINNTGGDLKLKPNTLDNVFEMWWPKLEEQIKAILSSEEKNDKSTKKRPERDILEEILELTRMNTRPISKNSTISRFLIGELMDGIYEIERHLSISKRKEIGFIMDEIELAFERLCIEFECYELIERFRTRRRGKKYSIIDSKE